MYRRNCTMGATGGGGEGGWGEGSLRVLAKE